MKKFLIYQSVMTLCAYALLMFFYTTHQANSFILGGLVSLFNVAVFAIMGKVFFGQKSVAIVFLLSVFKYPILGVFIYILVVNKIIDLPMFLVGVSMVLLASLFFGFKEYQISLRSTE